MIEQVKGTRNLYGLDAQKYLYIYDIFRSSFNRYGYDLIELPTIEHKELFNKSIGENSEIVTKQMYEFKDKGNRDLVGLSMFGLLFYSIISLLGEIQGFTLTLAGIAGIIVSIGLAADSYIVTFEKLKDEIKVGRSFEFAANRAVDESWKTILTADFVSLSAAFLLYVLAVGPIRGFALALGIATIFDLLFTRLYTRNMVPVIVSNLKNTRLMYPIKNEDITNV